MCKEAQCTKLHPEKSQKFVRTTCVVNVAPLSKEGPVPIVNLCKHLCAPRASKPPFLSFCLPASRTTLLSSPVSTPSAEAVLPLIPPSPAATPRPRPQPRCPRGPRLARPPTSSSPPAPQQTTSAATTAAGRPIPGTTQRRGSEAEEVEARTRAAMVRRSLQVCVCPLSVLYIYESLDAL